MHKRFNQTIGRETQNLNWTLIKPDAVHSLIKQNKKSKTPLLPQRAQRTQRKSTIMVNPLYVSFNAQETENGEANLVLWHAAFPLRNLR